MNVIVADDQRTVRESLVNGVNWAFLGIDQVYQAHDAEEVKDILKFHTVHLILTDIEMPGENGLELFAWIKEYYPEIECIFLTSHADFRYAQKAIQLGGYDYILQPARFEDIEKTVKSAVSKIVQKQRITMLEKTQDVVKGQRELLMNSFMERMLVCAEKEIDHLLKQLLDMLPERYQEEGFCLVEMEIIHWKDHKEEWSTRLILLTIENVVKEMLQDLSSQTMVCPKQNYGLFLIIYYDKCTISYEDVVKKIEQVYQFILEKLDFEVAFYLQASDREKFYENLQELSLIEKNNVMREASVFDGQKYSAGEAPLLIMDLEQWTGYLERGEGALVRKEIEEYCLKRSQRRELSRKILRSIHFYFSKALFAAAEKRKIQIQEIFQNGYSYEAFMESHTSYQNLMNAVDYCLNYLEKHDRTEKKDSVESALQYIRENISQNISRKEVANYVYLNEEYFSRLFKQKVGMTFKDYIIQERMKLAKKLLANTNFSIGIIASKVGYDNFSYFSKAFREFEKMTPQDYRQQYKK